MPEFPIPPLFLERMARLLGDEFPAFAAALEGEPVHGLRVNTLKLPVEDFRRISPFPLGETVPWCPSAFTLTPAPLPMGEGPGTRRAGTHPYRLAGLYYLQDPSAMSPAELLLNRPSVSGSGSAQGLRLLDLAAAPGGKTTHLAALMQGRGLLVANEIKDKRLGHLAANVERWGAGNVVITNETPERLADHFGAFFDRVLVDAPCSGEGMFRKDMGARRDWSPGMVAGCAARQGRILHLAAKLVRPGGHLLYSTCTFAPEENEAVIGGFLNGRSDWEVAPLSRFPGFMPGRPDWMFESAGHDSELDGAVRLFPHRVSGEGHFACLLQKRDGDEARENGGRRPAEMNRVQSGLWEAFAAETLKAAFAPDRLGVRAERLYLTPEEMPDFGALRVTHPGVWLGTFKKGRFEPAHPLALLLRPGGATKMLDLPADSRAMAAYLRGESLPSDGPPGWTLVTADSWPLGWGKRVQGVVKNHYPRGWQVYS